jgi:aminoglycoside phosphotransferase family enzyme
MINYDYYLMAKAGVVDQRKNEFNLEYDKARNKNTVVAKWIDDLRVESNSIQRELVQNGLDNFKREWDNTYELDSGIDTGQAFDLTVANCFPELSTEQIRLISQVDALIDIMEFIESISNIIITWKERKFYSTINPLSTSLSS